MEYLSDRDVATLQWGIRRVREIIATDPMAHLVQCEVSPGDAREIDSESIKTWVRT